MLCTTGRSVDLAMSKSAFIAESSCDKTSRGQGKGNSVAKAVCVYIPSWQENARQKPVSYHDMSASLRPENVVKDAQAKHSDYKHSHRGFSKPVVNILTNVLSTHRNSFPWYSLVIKRREVLSETNVKRT